MARRAARAARGGEGAHAAQRRAGAAAAAGTAVGSNRQGVSIRDRRGECLAGRPLPRALATPSLPLHVRARLHGRLPSLLGDGFNGFVVHLANHDVMLWVVSRAPLAKLQAYKRRMGWTFPWASSFGSDFNFDFNVWFTEVQQREGGVEYNYRREAAWQQREGSESGGEGSGAQKFAAMTGTDVATYTRERPGMSAFVLEDGVVYHAYSTYARGLDGLWGMYQWLDRAPKGRNETSVWWRRHDEYDKR
jgi:predicted dithiol-disulfide oxidoreductase (DUF899 family)